jgi:hypothetical protein
MLKKKIFNSSIYLPFSKKKLGVGQMPVVPTEGAHEK